MQYKLKKRYPSLPESWEIGDTVTKYFGYYKHDRMGMSSKTIFATEVENYPTFWEKVTEKEYEILTLITNVHSRISDFSDAFEDYLKAMLEDKDNVTIHSVKRLLDGEIFTIGDETTKGKIQEFIFFKTHLNVKGISKINDSFLCNIKDITLHHKKPLFTTEDGVNIYEGDEYWVVRTDKYDILIMRWTSNLTPCVLDPHIIPTDRDLYAKNGCLRFSSKEAAEEYILMNKPCLSINDIKYWLERHRVYSQDKISMTSFIDKLKQTINDK